MGTRYLLDTNVIIDFMGNRFSVTAQKTLSAIIDTEINLSVINKIELLGFSKVGRDIIDFVNYANIFPLDDHTVNKTIEIRSLYKIKLPDAIIAATALVNNFTLVSNNIKDFTRIPDIFLINIYSI
jgi:predicted nucleic acid-binding protein